MLVFRAVLLPTCYPVAASSVGLATPAPPRSRQLAKAPQGADGTPAPLLVPDTSSWKPRDKPAEGTRHGGSSVPLHDPQDLLSLPRAGRDISRYLFLTADAERRQGPDQLHQTSAFLHCQKSFSSLRARAKHPRYIHLTMGITIDSVHNDSANAVNPAYMVEPWMTKQQLSQHLSMSVRWIEMCVRDGMPMMRFGSRPRFRASEVEDWLSKQAKGTRQ